ncbi:cyclic nucleotide-gated ion channel 1-like isoform X2 [Rosa rugosa]|uniref:cyclic nucleotide-gated ion channel 1-like isoform X2 n=1 Tax=Rosa rugosa TaxID=74645 RepID=UPI002B40B44B|nr:cyclic nucleotide-gated ion channel 1-like isoform X2 [Rosa rugosa]XP_062003280.1 cyclic nucleotide-gated ion channel 1-like isoform X2 [Rosa rugosa]XP_062003281.1 cyclic nucleotide-gated ion channel 1-like isoform X2 [Rosa rugosa]
MSNTQVPNDGPMMSNTRGSKHNADNVESQLGDPLWKDPDTASKKQKLGETLISGSFWNTMFVIACVIAVSLDPLFFYIPVINAEQKCVAVNIELMAIALTLRSLTDVTFVVSIIYHVCKAINDAYKVQKEKKSDEVASEYWEFSKVSAAEIIPFAKSAARKLAWRSTLTSILAVFPMSQLLLISVFFEMRCHGHLRHRKILNFFVLAQYLPRIYRIYLSSQKLRQTTGIWTKALLNFFLYILASHVLGAFWYFFSIQRETSCWRRACVENSTVEGCMSTLYCKGHNAAARNSTFLNQLCSISAEENAKPHFDFGIFLHSLKNNITRDIPFGTKLSYSFWWGLRNLSNFGSNLETSNYVWETCFAVSISVIGLLLFIYLIGNVQTFVSMEAERWEDIRKKIRLKETGIRKWMDSHKLPENLKKDIMKNIEQKLEENKDTDLETLFFTTPMKCLRRFLGMELLKKVPKLKMMDNGVLQMMCYNLKPVKYDDGDEVFQKGVQLHRMLLITEGALSTCGTTSNDDQVATEDAEKGSISNCPSGNLDKGAFYGAEELIDWVIQKKNLCQLPISGFNVKCFSKVEGFVLTAKDLRRVFSKYEKQVEN